ncbi:MAG: TIGR04282 family arsenosugar biosynthesis glycosyltransferase [Planctomycetota bacterium]|jgi:rSAM/selenodomain-associated transferase 1
MSTITVLIFAKYPQAGTVNTRMVPPLTFEQAARLHQAALLAVWEKVTALAALDVKIVVTPDERVDDLRRLVGACAEGCWPQGDGNLGQRLVRATDRALSRNPGGVVALGADSPTLPSALLTEAVATLDGLKTPPTPDAVLGPCDDGGYYLIGVRRHLPVLFTRINWGGPDVARQTRERAATAGIHLAELRPWYDLDRYEDLPRAAKDLAEVTGPARPAISALRRLIESYIDIA